MSKTTTKTSSTSNATETTLELRNYAIKLSKLDQDEILKKLGIKHYNKNILNMTKAEILKEFGKTPKTLNKSLFIKNVIWQTYEYIKAGHNPMDKGNLRSFWYYIKDTMYKVGSKKDEADTISDMFMIMVKSGLFKYKDFDFEDDDKGNRWHARKFPHIILFAEKVDYNDVLQELNAEFDITTIATGGQPSCLSAEYFVSELKDRNVDISREFLIFSIVDFDPSGDIIATNFIDNLIDNGIKNIRIFPGIFYKYFKRKDLVLPENMTPEQKKKTYLLPLKIRKSGLSAKWAEKTGGVNGKKNILYGIASNRMSKIQLKEVFAAKLSETININLEQIAKYREMKTLKQEMQLFALKKLQLET